MTMHKLAVMLPVLYLSRKLDGEDENIIFLLRCSYAFVQTLLILGIAYVIRKVINVTALAPWMQTCIVYIPNPVPPFPAPDPNAKKQYKETTLAKHLLNTAYSLLKSTLGGVCVTVALHLYKGMVVGLAMQSAMGPLNLYDNVLAKAILTRQSGNINSSSWRELRLFGEKYDGELEEDDEIIDEEGNLIVMKKMTMMEVLRNVWDIGQNADVGPLLSRLNKGNINTRNDMGWTPFMCLAAIGVKDADDALQSLKEMGADPTIVDNEGWNALHWTAFHNSVKGTQFLLTEFAGKGLENAVDKEGKLPLDHAKDEKNPEIAKLIEVSSKKKTQ